MPPSVMKTLHYHGWAFRFKTRRRTGLGKPLRPVLYAPAMSRILITSALPYINGVKHLGNLAGSMLPADVHARFPARERTPGSLHLRHRRARHARRTGRRRGRSGTSETYCEAQHAVQRTLGERYGLSWDWFWPLVVTAERRPDTALRRMLLEDNRPDRGAHRQAALFRRPTDGSLPDRYIEGHPVPVCGFRPARGDQCDNCDSLLDPMDLKDPIQRFRVPKTWRYRETRHLLSPAEPPSGADPRLGRRARRSGPRSPVRSPTSTSMRA